MQNKKTTVRFFNTYEPVTTFYRDLLPYLAEKHIVSEVMISAAEYRQGGRNRLVDAFAESDIKVRYVSSLGVQPTSQLQKVVVMITYILGCIITTLFGSAPHVNFFLTQPPMFALWGWVLKRIRHQPYLCLVMDIYPDVAILDGILSSQSWLACLLTRLNRFTLCQADAVIVIGRCMAERVQDMGVNSNRIYFIPNWSNSDLVHPVPSPENRLRCELGLEQKLIILYSGNMGVSHDFDDLLEVIRRCQHEPDLHFILIGNGSRRPEIEQFLTNQRFSNVTLLPFQPLERLAESLSLGDVHFVSLREGFEGRVVPSKAYGALAAGRAIIYQGDKGGEIARMVEESDIGIVVHPHSAEQLENAVRIYLDCPEKAIQQGRKARSLIEGEYSANHIFKRYYQVIKEVVRA